MQLEAGLRVSEALDIRRADLAGETVDPVTGRWSGLLHIAGKGGHERTQYVPIQTYRDLERRLDENSGSVGVNYKPYLAALHRAADAVGEAWGGTHGLRHNYVRGFMLEAAAHGLGSDACMREVMHRVGHHRLSEVKTYLR
jgi:integrase